MKPTLSLLEFIKRHVFNILFLGFLAFLLFQRLPTWLSESKAQGQVAPGFSVADILNETHKLPVANQGPQILIFWATWCGPCHFEMSRFAKAVREGSIPGEKIHAISIGEDPLVVSKFLGENHYPFSIYVDPQGKAANLYQVQGTPTVVHIDGMGQIKWQTSGISPFQITRAKDLFLQ